MSHSIVRIIDADSERHGVQLARENCERWLSSHSTAAILEWQEILKRPWPEIRCIMLDDTDEGQRLRSSSPFAGVLSPRQRWQILQECREAR